MKNYKIIITQKTIKTVKLNADNSKDAVEKVLRNENFKIVKSHKSLIKTVIFN